jgi:carboxyl-terminal processing protease
MLARLLLGLVIATAGAPSDDFGKLWDDCVQAIGTRYYARAAKKDRMQSLFDKYAIKAKAAKSRDEFTQAMDAMIQEFGDSHFDFLPNTKQGFYLMEELAGRKSEMPHIGAWFQPNGDGYTVTMVLDGMQAEKAGLRKGDVIRKIDGEPFTPITSLMSRVGKKANLQVFRNGKSFEVVVEPVMAGPLSMFLEATRNSVRIIEEKGRKIGYFHLWTMANDTFRNALSSAVYGRLRETDAIILDIRDGFGGRPEGYGDPFFRPEVMLEWKVAERAGMKQLFGYQRPLVILTNGGSRSAKEVFSAIMKKSGRATLVGSPTAGHVLGTSPFRVSDWAHLEIPMVDVIVDGQRIESAGVSPDISLPREYDEMGKDLYVQEALKVLEERISRKRAA